MQLDMTITSYDFSMIWPQIAVVVFLLAGLLVDLLDKRGETTTIGIFSIFGMIVAGAFTIGLWNSAATVFDGMIIVDNYSLVFNLIFILGFILTALISIRSLPREGYNYSEYYILLMGATLGMMIMASAGNLLTVFIGIETLSISLYVLAGFARKREESNEAALKYLLLGAFSTGFLLYGIALIYGTTGTTDLTGIRDFFILSQSGPSIVLIAGVMLLLAGLMFKVSLVPFHMWAPDLYQGAPTPVAAFMSTGAKAAAFAVLFRVLVTALPAMIEYWRPVLYVIAILTMTIGNITAISQQNIKRMLAFSSIAHAGYLVIAILAFNQLGATAIMYYLLVYTLMNLGAFGVLAAMRRKNQANETLASFAGLANRAPFYAAMMAVFMLSLAGIPPMAGFIGKFMIFSAAIKEYSAGQSDMLPLVIIAVTNAVVSVFFYLRVVVVMYMNEPEQDLDSEPVNLAAGLSLIISAAGIFFLGIVPSYALDFIQNAILNLPK